MTDALLDRARAAVADLPDLLPLVTAALHPDLLTLVADARGRPRRPSHPAVDALLAREMDPPVRVLLLLVRHVAFDRLVSGTAYLDDLERPMPVFDHLGEWETEQVGERDDAFFLGGVVREHRWVFVDDGRQIAFLHGQTGAGFRALKPPSLLLWDALASPG